MVTADTGTANSGDPTNNIYKFSVLPGTPPIAVASYNAGPPNTPSNVLNMSIAGANNPHSNLMPYLTLNFCIALQGIFPPRS
jgi:microcystin-dependent protein